MAHWRRQALVNVNGRHWLMDRPAPRIPGARIVHAMAINRGGRVVVYRR